VGRFPDDWLLVVGRGVLRSVTGVLVALLIAGIAVVVAMLCPLLEPDDAPVLVLRVAEGTGAVLILLVSLGRLPCWLSVLCWIARNMPAMSATRISSAII